MILAILAALAVQFYHISAILQLINNVAVILLDSFAFLAVVRQVWGLWKLKRSLGLRSNQDIATSLIGQGFLRFSLSALLICEFTLDLRRRNSKKIIPNQSALNLPTMSFQDNPVQSVKSVFGRLHENLIAEMGERNVDTPDLLPTGTQSSSKFMDFFKTTPEVELTWPRLLQELYQLDKLRIVSRLADPTSKASIFRRNRLLVILLCIFQKLVKLTQGQNEFEERLRRRKFIDKLPGPPRSSWLTGNLPDLLRSTEISDAPFAWLREYGTVVRSYAEFGRKTLFVSDPKAIQYILNTSGYNFPRTWSDRALVRISLGEGLVWAEGKQHAQQRKIMTPAFSFNTLRGFIPLFREKARKTVNKIKEQIESEENPATANVVNIVPWLSRMTLDIIGVAAADYDFEALDGGQNNRLTQAYGNVMADAFYKRSDIDIIVAYLMGKIPEFVYGPFMKILPTRSLKRIKRFMSVASTVARDAVDKQTALYTDGQQGSNNLMGILVRANLSENPRAKLTDEEVISQLTTFFFAGHETTSSTLVWALYELSRHPEYQTKVREEIRATCARVAERNDGEITIPDLDSMQYLLALVKASLIHKAKGGTTYSYFKQETLRVHPIVGGIFRQAGQDDQIPLSVPVTLTTGEVVTSLPIERGQQVTISFINYNRLKSVWGEDANAWRPERFLETQVDKRKQRTNLGVMSNIGTFSSGVRGCIGWRFSVLEMQVILIELLTHFEFSPPPGDIEILRVSVGLMGPMVKGSTSGRLELPLTITPLQA
ncbi:hypothetical protein Clacol_001222 [Clathrus columnatus]|uniref:Cytochrome P450 n=1 Tax=Clathrus columnatus TaxID=1419009 RepID=A0AAV5A157_9AGAM|nr:hypothetical protein Clacol_001222 [Clathrus columnatus]